MAQTPDPIDELDPYNSTAQPGQRVRIIIETTLHALDPNDSEPGRVDVLFAGFPSPYSGKTIGHTIEIPEYELRPEDDRYSIEILD
jgi:hypothetical protein